MNKLVTFQKVANGEFNVLLNGTETSFTIVNGSKGLSGHTSNIYGISKDGISVRWIGTLQACKKILNFTLTKEGK